jgi:hypothetical protein
LGDTLDYNTGTIHSEVVEIVCKAIGTGHLSQCRYTRGTPLFAALVRMYLMQVENDRALVELKNTFTERMQIAMWEIVQLIASDRIAEIPHQLKDGKEDMFGYKPISDRWRLDDDLPPEPMPHDEEPKE